MLKSKRSLTTLAAKNSPVLRFSTINYMLVMWNNKGWEDRKDGE